jgi:nicotinate phosphoribosyltransferase
VWRRYDAAGRMVGDRIGLDDAASTLVVDAGTKHDRGEPLLDCVMRDGRRLAPSPSLDQIRSRAKRELERLPEALRRLEPGATYPVEIGEDLIRLAEEVDSRTRQD